MLRVSNLFFQHSGVWQCISDVGFHHSYVYHTMSFFQRSHVRYCISNSFFNTVTYVLRLQWEDAVLGLGQFDNMRFLTIQQFSYLPRN